MLCLDMDHQACFHMQVLKHCYFTFRTKLRPHPQLKVDTINTKNTKLEKSALERQKSEVHLLNVF